MSILSRLFGGGDDPSQAAMPYLNQIPGVGHSTYDPYINRGNAAGNKLSGQYDELLNDPTALINKLMEAYRPSEGYQFQKKELTDFMGNNAAAGGFSGTPYDTNQQAGRIQGLLSQDMQQFLTNALGRYDKGLTGFQGFADQGFESSKGLGDLLGNNLAAQGGLAFQGQQQKNSNQNQMFQALAQVLGGVGGLATQPKGSLFGKRLWG